MKVPKLLPHLSLFVIVLTYAIFLYHFTDDIKLLIVQLSEKIKADENFLLLVFSILHSLVFTYVYFKVLWFFRKRK